MEGNHSEDSLCIPFVSKNGVKFEVFFEDNDSCKKILPYFTYRIKDEEEILDSYVLGNALEIIFERKYDYICYEFYNFTKFSAKIRIRIFYATNKDFKSVLKNEFVQTDPKLIILKECEINLKDLLKHNKIPNYDFLLETLKQQAYEKIICFKNDVLDYIKSNEKEKNTRWSRYPILGEKTFIFIDEA